MKIAIIIPAYNEGDSLPLVMGHLPKEFRSQTVVVNNNSTDHTQQVLDDLGVHSVFEPRQGYGQACLSGFEYAEAHFDFDTIVYMDADFSDHQEDIYRLIERHKTTGAELVIGSRNLGEAEAGSLTPQQVFGNGLATFLMRLLTGVRFSDLGPFRLITRRAYLALNMVDTNYGWTMEMQVKAALAKIEATEVSVRYRKRIGVSKISGTLKGTLCAGYKILTTLFKYRFLVHPEPKHQEQAVFQ
ncbi:MAG: UDP-glucose--dolichyl-phosphate glucosyltransferase [Bdellovibrionaceae bacterium]|nr:UDP-glucose--dolichyl-phosphate glucosyltransferase [Pseudobdellovibrionaceae bacterium]|tara:strand:- start:4537 stop:5265 length:729 start_codon:yes stop_codon:yes gene_type:complete